MDDAGVGWIVAIIVGGIAGWLAGKFMNMRFGLLLNIVIGIVGAAIAGVVLPRLGIGLGSGAVNYLINGFIGAVILLFVVKLVKK